MTTHPQPARLRAQYVPTANVGYQKKTRSRQPSYRWHILTLAVDIRDFRKNFKANVKKKKTDSYEYTSTHNLNRSLKQAQGLPIVQI